MDKEGYLITKPDSTITNIPEYLPLEMSKIKFLGKL